MDDPELLRRYIDTGLMEYFGELYSRYIPLVYGLCLKYLRSTELAEDAVMQIFEELAPKVGRFEIREFRTWVYSVARNHCLQQLRKHNPEVSLDNFGTVFMESDTVVHPLSKQEDEGRLAILEKCLEQLPEPQRKSIRMFFYEEKSYVDIVDATDYHLKSVKSYIQNGKRNLKICMEKEGAGS